MLHYYLVKYDALGHRKLRRFMFFAGYDLSKRCLAASEVIWWGLSGVGGAFVLTWGPPRGLSGRPCGVWGVLGEALGWSLGSLGGGQGSLGA